MTQRRIAGSTRNVEEALQAVAAYATTWTCRQQMLCAHFAGSSGTCDACRPQTACAHVAGTVDACGTCDACRGPAPEAVSAPAAAVLGSAEQQIILAALAAHGRAVGKGTLAKALRGSRAKAVVVHGLDRLAQHGVLAAWSEADVAETIESLIRERKLVRRGRKYPTVALAGKPRAPRTTYVRRGRDGSRTSSITVELDRYRKQMARKLRWKAYMVFQRSVITAIDRERPESLAALARIAGLGPNRIARFGEDLLAIVRRYGDGGRAEPVGPAVRDLFSQLARDP
jgi:ATP-dependent DNA helicase RecQ